MAADSSDDGQFYKQKAVEFSRSQISVDTFLFSPNYTDVATIGSVSRYTAGHCYYYPAFDKNIDRQRLMSDIVHDLTRTTGLEAVMRIRCSHGLRVRNFYGNFFIRGADLLSLPNVNSDTAMNAELAHTEALQPGSVMSFQAALLYTSPEGERRICVHTMAKPVTTVLTDMFNNVPIDAISNMISKIALDNLLRTGLVTARRYLHRVVVEIIRGYAAAKASGQIMPGAESIEVPLPDTLQELPYISVSGQGWTGMMDQ